MPDTSGTILAEDSKKGWYPIEEDGTIKNTSSLDYIPSSVKPALIELAEEIVKEFGSGTSVYLRGSIVKGNFIPGFSDVDMVVIYQKEKLSLERKLVKSMLDLVQKSSLGQVIDLHPISEKKLKEANEFIRLRFLVQISGVCLLGNKTLNLEPPPLLAKSHHQIQTLQEGFPKFEKYLGRCDEQATRKFCRWVMKTIVRAGYELVMEKENKYTRDLLDCLDGFAAHYPRQKSRMKEAVEFAVTPVSNSNDFRFVMSSLSLFILAKAKDLNI